MTTPTTSTAFLPQLVSICRTLTNLLTDHALSASQFDDEAFIACESAETLLASIQRVYGPLDGPEIRALLIDAARKRAEEE